MTKGNVHDEKLKLYKEYSNSTKYVNIKLSKFHHCNYGSFFFSFMLLCITRFLQYLTFIIRKKQKLNTVHMNYQIYDT